VREKFLVFGQPDIRDEDIDEVLDTLRSRWIGTGPKVAKFEQEFKDYIGAKHAIAVSSCTAAMELSLLVAGIGDGDEVITTPLTFAATANVIRHVGATPVFVDVDRFTGLIDAERIEDAITEKTRAIMPVHLYGRPCDMDRIMEIAERHELVVIEDAAHAVESVYRGRKIGTIGDFTCFSFYVNKNITTCEGGMVTTHRLSWAERIRVLSHHGLSTIAWKRVTSAGHYEVVEAGYKYNLTDINAALGLNQLKRVEESWRRRREIFERYNEAFDGLPCWTPPEVEEGSVHAYHLYTLIIDTDRLGKTRDEVRNELLKMNIGTGIHYISLHLHPYYMGTFGFRPDDFPNARWISERTLSLPLSPALTDDDVADVIDAVRKVLGG